MDLKAHIRTVEDFPKPGILFRDITPLLSDPAAFREVIDRFTAEYRDKGVTVVAAPEARGFIFAAPLALELNAAFAPMRKPGKLPFDTHSFDYDLEYGTDTLERHSDAFKAGDRILMVDDLLATGGTMNACIQLTGQVGVEIVGCAFVVELSLLRGRSVLAPVEVFSLIEYE